MLSVSFCRGTNVKTIVNIHADRLRFIAALLNKNSYIASGRVFPRSYDKNYASFENTHAHYIHAQKTSVVPMHSSMYNMHVCQFNYLYSITTSSNDGLLIQYCVDDPL